ncbi:MAG: hypothetical protein CMO60_00225 [Verrucomicrobiales bacterium]|nr:hypothetical protein [Verrucomicrobiales bacterium]
MPINALRMMLSVVAWPVRWKSKAVWGRVQCRWGHRPAASSTTVWPAVRLVEMQIVLMRASEMQAPTLCDVSRMYWNASRHRGVLTKTVPATKIAADPRFKHASVEH